MDTIDPRIVRGVVEWADFMFPSLEEFGTPSRLDDPGDWQEWAVGLLSFDGFEAVAMPDPYLFDNWIEWAERFNQAVGGN